MKIDLRLESNFDYRCWKEFRKASIVYRLNRSVWIVFATILKYIFIGVAWFFGGPALAGAVGGIITATESSFSAIEQRKLKQIAHHERRRAYAALAAQVAGGQFVNTRQANDSVRILYGIVRTGGTWVFNKTSRINNEIMNMIVSWGEGEVEGLGNAIDYVPVYSGTTLNDMTTSGELVSAGCSCDNTCYIYTPCSCYVYA